MSKQKLQPRLGRPAKYQYGRWTDGRIWTLHRGKHFDVSIDSFRRAMKAYASDNGFSVVVLPLGDGRSVQIQFSKRTEPKAAK
jgi:hypothetical protein